MIDFLIPLAIMFMVTCIGYVYTIIIHFKDNKNAKK